MDKTNKVIEWILRQPWGEEVANLIVKQVIEEYMTSLVMYKKSTMAVLDRLLDHLDKGGE